jgi:uncharacterized protein (DUF433 family)
MANLDWSQCPAVESVPGKVSGAWTFRNSRTPVKLIFENLDDGMTIDEIVEQYPVSREEIKVLLEFAGRSLDLAPSFWALLILLDNNVPRGVARALTGHTFTEAREARLGDRPRTQPRRAVIPSWKLPASRSLRYTKGPFATAPIPS